MGPAQEIRSLAMMKIQCIGQRADAVGGQAFDPSHHPRQIGWIHPSTRCSGAQGESAQADPFA